MKKRIVAIVAIIALIAILGVVLCACNASSYEKKLKKAGYTVEVVEDEDKDADIVWMVEAFKMDGLKPINVTVVKFAKTDDAKDAAEDAKSMGMSVKRSGKIVIEATSEQGLKDAK